MVEIILVSHGNYAKAMLESSTLIMGEQDHVTAFGFFLGENVEDLRKKISEKMQEIMTEDPTTEIMVFTDMKSGSPFNAASLLMQEYQFIHIAGINLPILLEVLGTRDFSSAQELRSMIFTIGRDTIVDVNQMLEE